MSRTLNRVTLIGNVGREPELKKTPGGVPVTSFRLATSESWKDKEGNLKEHTDWHTIVAWRGLAKVINKLVTKGTRLYIEGRLQTRNFQDNDGNRKQVVEILAENMLLLEDRKNGKVKDNPDYNPYDNEKDNENSDYDDDDSSDYSDDDYKEKSKKIEDEFDERFEEEN